MQLLNPQNCNQVQFEANTWMIASPSSDKHVSHERQTAIQELKKNHSQLKAVCKMLTSLPNLERQLTDWKTHTFESKNHPVEDGKLSDQKSLNKKTIRVRKKRISLFHSFLLLFH